MRRVNFKSTLRHWAFIHPKDLCKAHGNSFPTRHPPYPVSTTPIRRGRDKTFENILIDLPLCPVSTAYSFRHLQQTHSEHRGSMGYTPF